MKKTPADTITLHMCTVQDNHMMHGSPNNPKNQNFEKMKEKKKQKKNVWRYYHFTHVHHKWQSYDVWFLRYGA